MALKYDSRVTDNRAVLAADNFDKKLHPCLEKIDFHNE